MLAFYVFRYRVYDLPRCLYTKPVWESANPNIEETVHFSALNASYDFLNYLQKNALIVDLWGLQGISFQNFHFWKLYVTYFIFRDGLEIESDHTVHNYGYRTVCWGDEQLSYSHFSVKY